MKITVSLSKHYSPAEVEEQLRKLESMGRYMDPDRYDRLVSVYNQRLKDSKARLAKNSFEGSLRRNRASVEEASKKALTQAVREMAETQRKIAEIKEKGRVSPGIMAHLERQVTECLKRVTYHKGRLEALEAVV